MFILYLYGEIPIQNVFVCGVLVIVSDLRFRGNAERDKSTDKSTKPTMEGLNSIINTGKK